MLLGLPVLHSSRVDYLSVSERTRSVDKEILLVRGASNGLTNRARLSFETVKAFFAAIQNAALTLEVGHREDW